jgi:dephospho-CoA kinase
VQNFYLIGLIGNLGSGKSTVRQMLEQMGARGIDADALAHVVMQRGSPTWRAIVETFGAEILRHDGRIDRRVLGARVFADAATLRKLEGIVHPAVSALTRELLREIKQPVVVIEAIKLIESGMNLWCDALWAVTCTPEKQIERVMRTRQISAEDARARIAAQGALDEKLRLANLIIDNSKDVETTRDQIAHGWKTIRPETARDKSSWLWAASRTDTLPESAVAPAVPVVPATPPAPAPSIVSPASSVPSAFSADAPSVVSPAPPPAITPLPAPSKTQIDFEVRRTRRGDLNALAVAIAKRENRPQPLSHEEAVKRFGSGGYRIAIGDGRIVAFAAWEAENLVATVRELWAESSYIALLALPQLLALIENEAQELLCEVIVIFVEPGAPLHITEQPRASGYQLVEVNNLHPVWQMIVHERLKLGERIMVKRLREEMITKPM